MGDLSAHFSRHEFRCHCGCGRATISSELVAGLELLRDLVCAHLDHDTPLVPTSGYRCPPYNLKVGGKPHSLHLVGKAADLLIPAGMTVESLAGLAENVEAFRYGGIGQYPVHIPKPGEKSRRLVGWVHVDVRSGKKRWVE